MLIESLDGARVEKTIGMLLGVRSPIACDLTVVSEGKCE